MKDFCEIYKDQYGTKYYYNEKDDRHRLIGPAVEWCWRDKSYYINGILYLGFYKNYNELFIFPKILLLTSEYEKYIKQNIKDLIQEYNPEIKLYSLFYKRANKSIAEFYK